MRERVAWLVCVVCVALCVSMTAWAHPGAAGTHAEAAVEAALDAARQGSAHLSGPLDKDEIRAVVRKKSAEVRYCYEDALSTVPTLEGDVLVRFVISVTGAVASARVTSSTLGSEAVEECMIERVKAWTFPKVNGGGTVVVNYPFAFSSADGSAGKGSDRKVEGVKRPPVHGSLSKELIRRVVRANRGELRRCYEKQLRKNPKLRGEVKVKFIIGGTGRIEGATVTQSTLRNAKVEACMVDAIKKWVFPKPKGGGEVIVNYPFKFST